MSEINSSKFALCTTCFRLRDLRANTIQRCQCQGPHPAFYRGFDCPSGNVLCLVCARRLAGGYSRYSWNACENCKAANKKFHSRMGFALPLGCHSIMNGVSLQTSLIPEFEEKEFNRMMEFVRRSGDLWDWGILRSRELFESVPEWANLPYIPIEKWEKKFESSIESSLEAFAMFYGVKDAKELRRRLKDHA